MFLEIGHNPNPKPKINIPSSGNSNKPESRPGTAEPRTRFDINTEEGKQRELEVMHEQSGLVPGADGEVDKQVDPLGYGSVMLDDRSMNRAD